MNEPTEPHIPGILEQEREQGMGVVNTAGVRVKMDGKYGMEQRGGQELCCNRCSPTNPPATSTMSTTSLLTTSHITFTFALP